MSHNGNDHHPSPAEFCWNLRLKYYHFRVNSDEERLQQKVFALIAANQGIKLKDISLSKSINLDLGVDGDDAVELLLAYSGEFHVDIEPLGEEWDRYFGAQPSLRTALRRIASFGSRKRDPKLPLPVSRLVASARAGKWIPPAA